jgi:hypothetical protein
MRNYKYYKFYKKLIKNPKLKNKSIYYNKIKLFKNKVFKNKFYNKTYKKKKPLHLRNSTHFKSSKINRYLENHQIFSKKNRVNIIIIISLKVHIMLIIRSFYLI